ncbi:transcription factor GATA-6-like, partial [Anopheles maculipalpis]|uniref:transcription factor GATA-6-like n=1 Tax=Anopheles maculipalpis TaxID=1496333 RepID=UPI002158FFAE
QQPRSISTATARTATSARTGSGAGGNAIGSLGCTSAPSENLTSLSASTTGTLPAGLYYGGGNSNAGFTGSASYIPPPPSFPWSTGIGASSSGTVGHFAGGLASRARHHQLSRPPPLAPSASTPSSISSTAAHGGTGGYNHHIQTRFGSSASGNSATGAAALLPPTSSSSLNRCSSIDQYHHSAIAAIGSSSSSGSNTIGSLNNMLSGGIVAGMANVKKEDLLKQRLAKLQSITPTTNGSP